MNHILLATILCAGTLAAAVPGCRDDEYDGAGSDAGADDGECSAHGELLGRWERLHQLQLGSETEVDRWRVTFLPDCSFDWTQDETESLDSLPFETVETRQGTFSAALAEGRVTLDGELVRQSDGSSHTFHGELMVVFGEEPGVLYLGPDSRLFANWPYMNSYKLLFHDASSNQLVREFTIRVEDDEGGPEEQWIERYEFNVNSTGCYGSYEHTYTGGTIDDQFEGDFTDCQYALTEAVEVIGPGGEQLQVQSVVFTYESGDLPTTQEFYMAVGDAYLGYNPSMQAIALRNSAFVRTHTVDQL